MIKIVYSVYSSMRQEEEEEEKERGRRRECKKLLFFLLHSKMIYVPSGHVHVEDKS